MYISVLFLASFLSLCLGAASSNGYVQPGLYEAIKQREAIIFDTIDTQDWDRLHESVTQDYVHDSRPLGPVHGGLFVGLERCIEDLKQAFGGAMTAHQITNFIIRPNRGATEVNATIYAAFSRWDLTELHNPNRTLRMYVKYHDQFVMEHGTWKIKHRLATNLAPQIENPYFNDA